jgi:hypothetical protein
VIQLPKLLRLTNDGQRLATPDLASGETEQWGEATWLDVVAAFSRDVALGPLHKALDGISKRFEPFDTAIDGALAPELHRALRLTRREAADLGLWRFLTVVARPDFVRHRWEYNSWAQMRARFLRGGTRPDSNALCRLWWIAELTQSENDYSLTERVLRSQSLANAIFVRSLSFYRPAIAAIVEVLGGEAAEEVERRMVLLTRWLAVTPLEGLSFEQLVARLRSLRP